MKDKLKPCPFCPSGKAKPKSITRSAHLVECSYCEASTGLYITIKRAIKAWNRRPKK